MQEDKDLDLELDIVSNDILDDTEICNDEPKVDDLDKQYDIGNRKHRNTLSVLDHIFKYIIHPFMISFITIVVCVAFVAIRWITFMTQDPFLDLIEKDLRVFMSYFGTAVITYIITAFLGSSER